MLIACFRVLKKSKLVDSNQRKCNATGWKSSVHDVVFNKNSTQPSKFHKTRVDTILWSHLFGLRQKSELAALHWSQKSAKPKRKPIRRAKNRSRARRNDDVKTISWCIHALTHQPFQVAKNPNLGCDYVLAGLWPLPVMLSCSWLTRYNLRSICLADPPRLEIYGKWILPENGVN